MSKAFSLIELVFVLLIIAVLAGIALPYFHVRSNDAQLLKLKAELEMIRTSIGQARNTNLLKDIDAYPKVLDESAVGVLDVPLFFCSKAQQSACTTGLCCTNTILERAVISSKRAWLKTGINAYSYALTPKIKLDFKYDNTKGEFECEGKLCKAYGL